MKTLFANADVGKKNILFGIVLFLLLGVMVGIPLTMDLLGGSLLSSDQYHAWMVVHGYGVFLAFINYFLGLAIDRLEMPRQHKEIVSWSFLAAGLIGGVVRMVLVLASSLSVFGRVVSLAETALFVLGMIALLRGQFKEKASRSLERTSQPDYSRVR